jgi:uracil-DNA glycosylase
VSDGIPQPPSLQNIFKELKSDLGIPIPKTGNLEPWAKQGVLLLNATLTVRANQPGSHQKQGWEQFTDAAIKTLSEKRKGLVFILWGKFAQAKEILIDTSKHHILKAPHPSPFSVHSGFFGCRHFSKTNELLKNERNQLEN